MEQMQFTAIVLMILLMLKLLMLPVRVTTNAIVNRSRCLMTVGMVLIAVQFLLQYSLRLRAMGVTQAVMFNLALFVPASWVLSLAILYLQRQGRVNVLDRWLGFVTWMMVLVVLGVAAAIDGQPLLSDTPELHKAEIIASGCFMMMVAYYVWRHLKNLKAMRQALDNYYDRDMDGLLHWMRMSVIILPVMGLMVPLLIFVQSPLLAVFALLFFAGIFYLIDSFCSYAVSSAPMKVQEAESSEESREKSEKIANAAECVDCSASGLSLEATQRVEHAVSEWLNKGCHLQTGMKLPTAAEGIGVPQYLLTAWLRQQNLKYAEWLTNLRIEEAKRILVEHPDWSNEAIAQQCGFADRSYFQKKFKEKTGLSPADFIGRH